MNDRAISIQAQVQASYADRLRQFYQDAHTRYQQGGDPSLHSFLEANRLAESSFANLPPAVLEAFRFYDRQVRQQDWGTVWIAKTTAAGQLTYAILVNTDGDDGWLEVFDDRGTLLGAARTYLELAAWGEPDAIRAQVATGEFPSELNDRSTRTLWQV